MPSCSALPARLFSTTMPTIRQSTGEEASFKTTTDIFQKQLHAYTITHAIEDRNVLRFHVDYYKAESNNKSATSLTQESVVKAILAKHDKATAGRKFNALLATASINHAIEYHRLFKELQEEQQEKQQEQSKAEGSTFLPLNIACVFSPTGGKAIKTFQQLQEDLTQEKADNAQYGSNHHINEFDLYYQDVQKRIKDQKYANADLPHREKNRHHHRGRYAAHRL